MNLNSDPEDIDVEGEANDTGFLPNGTNSHLSSRSQTPERTTTAAPRSADPYEFHASENEMEEERQTMQDMYGANGGELLNADLRSKNDRRFDAQFNADSTQSEDMSGSGAGSSDVESLSACSPNRAQVAVRVLNSTPSKQLAAVADRGTSHELSQPKRDFDTWSTPTSSSSAAAVTQWTQLHESTATPMTPYVVKPEQRLLNSNLKPDRSSSNSNGVASDLCVNSNSRWAERVSGSSCIPSSMRTDPNLRVKPTDEPTVIEIGEDHEEAPPQHPPAPVPTSSRPSFTPSPSQPKPTQKPTSKPWSTSDYGAYKPLQSYTAIGITLVPRTCTVQ